MQVELQAGHCPKCDERLKDQSDGSRWVEDIAHHGERVHEALAKLDQIMTAADYERPETLLLIVGGGRIRDAVLARLKTLQRSGLIHRYHLGDSNRGQIEVMLRKATLR